MIQSPCYKCPKCPCKEHDICPDYLKWKAQGEAERKENMKIYDLKDYVNRAIMKRRKRYRK